MASLCTDVDAPGVAGPTGRTGGGAGAGARTVAEVPVPEAAPGVAVAGTPVPVAGPRAAVAGGVEEAAFDAAVAEVVRAPDNGGADVHAVAPSSPATSAATPARTRHGNSNSWAME
jgi:hypothetical protein